MRKFVWILLILLCATEGFAKNKTKKKTSELQGIWQMCLPSRQSESNKVSITGMPVIKILSADKTFNNIVLNITKGSVITTNGTWKQTSDSTYTETICRSVTDPLLTGKTNQLKFKLVTPDLLRLTYQLDGAPRKQTEYWGRVVMPASLQRGKPLNNIQ